MFRHQLLIDRVLHVFRKKKILNSFFFMEKQNTGCI